MATEEGYVKFTWLGIEPRTADRGARGINEGVRGWNWVFGYRI
jgi:hypothetical protein